MLIVTSITNILSTTIIITSSITITLIISALEGRGGHSLLRRAVGVVLIASPPPSVRTCCYTFQWPILKETLEQC